MSKNDIKLKELGFKVTQPRLKILKLFETHSDKHFTADEIYALLKSENIGIATVYRVLNQFESAGLISRLKLNNDQIKYELDDGKHHDHIICLNCSSIHEFYSDEIEELQKKIVKEKMDSKIIDHSLNIYVDQCSKCKD